MRTLGTTLWEKKMLRYDEGSQLLDQDVPRIAHNIGALIFMLFSMAVGSILTIAFLILVV